MTAEAVPSDVLTRGAVPVECDLSGDARTIAIVGCGPVGHRVASELLSREGNQPVSVFGAENWAPYNRVQLSSLMVGEMQLPDLFTPLEAGDGRLLARHYNCAVVAIDRETRTLLTADGRLHRWSKLVFATGSNPHIPNIDGIRKTGVYTFRNLDDAQHLAARRTSARTVIVLGGGLLGLEVARGMQRHNTDVIVIDHANHLMSQQLDQDTAEELRNRVLATGIRVITGCGVKKVEGGLCVEGVTLMNGRQISCDTVIVATGIRPNTELAKRAGLECGRGIRVNERMQTTDPNIFAAGECIELDDEIFGLVAPGLAQASVVAENLNGRGSAYFPTSNATRLKVFGTTVFSMGETHDERPLSNLVSHAYRRTDTGDEVRIFTRRGRLVGASAIGSHADIGSLQESVARRRVLWPWRRRHFLRTGFLSDRTHTVDVIAWPASAIVCNCMGVSRGKIGQVVDAGAGTVEQVCERTGASSVCGGCKPLVADLLGKKPQPEPGARALIWTARCALVLALLMILPLAIPYAQSVLTDIAWDQLWRDTFIKQVTGFSLLGSSVVLVLIGLRKRIRGFRFLDYSIWRVLHVCIGLGAVGLLVAHTGLRTGYNLNSALMVSFVGVVVAGGAASWLIGIRHNLGARWARDAVDTSLWIHILCLWPLPVLLGFHILKVYWY